MKKNMNAVVLIIEIVAITILHAAKIKQSEKNTQSSLAATHVSAFKHIPVIKPDFMLIKVIK